MKPSLKAAFKTYLGFTLIELLIVIAISAILFAVAVPSYRSLMANYRASQWEGTLTSALRLARSEAIRQNAKVKVCALSSQTDTSCDDGGANWEWGFGVYLGATSNLIQLFQPSTVKGIQGPASSIVFIASGFVSPSGTYSFTITPIGCTEGYTVEVSAAGKISSTKIQCVANGSVTP